MASGAFRAGDRLGKYEIIREIATGGMATIYLARVSGTAGFEKLVVLKCILPALADDRGFVSMFLDEARLAATLRHSNIAAVFDVGMEDGTYFFAMEYVHGQNARMVRIEAKQQGVPIPLEVALAIVGGTAAALGYAHERTGPSGPLHLVHRDVSLSNVLVSYEGAIKLVDFGIARANLRSRVRTRTGLRRGKAPYMSPEQCRGEVIDGRSDLFSLGTLFYELTTGRRPFFGSSDFEVMEAIVTGDPTPPSVLVDDYPQPLEDMVMRLLARSPSDRYQKASAFLDDLDAFIARGGLRTSAYVVAKYMKELFGETATAKVQRDADRARLASGHDAADEEPTAAFKRAEQIDLMGHPRAVRRAPATSVPDESFHEPTRQDPALPFDPIDARSQELLEHIDAEAPPDETLGARAYRRVQTLLHRAIAFAGMGELDKAVTAVELALDEAPRTPAVQKLLQGHVDTILGVYEAMLEGPYRTPVLVRRMNELIPVELEPRARLLLPWIDGKTTIRDLIARSGMQRLEAYHHLCQFLLRGIIT